MESFRQNCYKSRTKGISLNFMLKKEHLHLLFTYRMIRMTTSMYTNPPSKMGQKCS